MYMQNLISPDAINRYVNRRKSEVANCYDAVNNSEYSALYDIGHKILGSCQTFGFRELEDIAKDLQEAALSKDKLACTSAVQCFENWVQRNS